MASSFIPFRLIFFLLCVFCYFQKTEAQTFPPYYYKSSVENSTQSNIYSYGVALDSQNATYVVGSTDGTVFATWNDNPGPSRTTDMLVMKYTSIINSDTLNRVWGKQPQTTITDAAYATHLSVDEAYLYVAGIYNANPAVFELQTSDGSTTRSYTYPVTNVTNFFPRFQDVTPCGVSVCACGYYYTNSTSRWEGLIVRLNGTAGGPSFTLGWTKIISKGTGSDDLMNTIAYGSTTRLFVAGQMISASFGKEFYLTELNIGSGATVFERSWPGTSCSGVGLGTGDIDNYISDIVLGSNALYYVGASNQEIDSSGGTSTDVCGYGFAMVIGSLPLANLSVHNWAINVSLTLTGYNVYGNSISLGNDGVLYVGGNSDADTILGQTGSNPLYMDWFFYTLNATNGSFIDFHLEGKPVDDYCNGLDVRTQNGAMALTVSTALTKNTVTNDYITNAPDPSPSPSITPSPSRTPSVTPTASPTPSATPTVTPTPSVSATPSPTPSKSATPSSTPSSSVSPSITPSTSKSPSSSPSNGSAPSASATLTPSYTPPVTPSVSPSMTPFPVQGKKNNELPIILGVVLGAAVLCLVGAVLFFVVKRKRDQEKRKKFGNLGPDPESRGNSTNSVRLSVLTTTINDNWIIDYKQIEIGAEIGRGAYGTVFRGKWRGSTVAVKQLNLEKNDQRAIDDFIKETSAVQRLRNHRNVCQIFGVCTDPEYPICIVMEYMEDGNLQNLVYKGKVQLDVDAILTMAKHTASGMSHLHSENILHCDLACRNLLVTIGKGNKYLVKISDFGMARVVENEKIYNASSEAQFPVRWSAPEVLSSGTVSRKSDVWSFGVTVWEMIEGVKPYYELSSNKEVIEFVVVNGYRLPRPKKIEIPATLWEIMNQCWSPNPADRPEFEEILKKLANLKKVLRASVRGSQLQDPTNRPQPTGEIKPGGETYLTIGEFKKGGQEVASVNSDEEYNTLGAAKNQNKNYAPKANAAPAQDDDTYNKVSVKLTATEPTSTEDDYKAVIHLKADATQGAKLPPPIAPTSDEDTYNKINFKNEFANQKPNNNNAVEESDYLQINKPIFGGPAQAPPARPTPTPPPRVVEESDYTARVNLKNEFTSPSQSADNDDYSTVRLNTTSPGTPKNPPKQQHQQQQADEDTYSKVVLKTNSSATTEESDYNVINFHKQSNAQDLYLNNKDKNNMK